MSLNRYETDKWLAPYLLFHYGTEKEQLGFAFGPKSSLNFPVRCVTECLDSTRLSSDAKALDIGCAVGRSSFELARFCKEVMAIDYSHTFINAAKHLQEKGQLEYSCFGEGGKSVQVLAKTPEDIDLKRVEFRQGDAMDLFLKSSQFDVVLAANLLCRLSNPLFFLEQIHTLVAPGGQLILTSPYSWSEEFTPKNAWLGAEENHQKTPLESIKEILVANFHFVRAFDMPFLIREHRRFYQWGIAEASIWHRTNQ